MRRDIEREGKGTELVTHFGCGSLIGIVIGVGVGLELLDWFGPTHSGALFVGGIVVSALVCGVLSVRLRERFWRRMTEGDGSPSFWDWF